MRAVLDASALLAYLQDEPGTERVEEVLLKSYISSVNWAEVVQKSIAASVTVEGMRYELAALGLTIVNFEFEDAEQTAKLWQQTRQYGLSLGDRACLSLGLRLSIPVFTTDRAWMNLDSAFQVNVIR